METQPTELTSDSHKRYMHGLVAALSCSTLWGILPIYWQSLRPISSEVIILYRVFLMGVLCLIGSLYIYGVKGTFYPFKTQRKKIVTHFLAGLLITVNWSLYIWAVNANYVIQTAMGYFLEPLVVCGIGVIVFKEKLNNLKKLALVIALMALVLWLLVIINYRS